MVPKRFLKVGGILYEVVRRKQLVDDDGTRTLVGQVQYEKCRIYVKKAEPQHELETLLHETVHIILKQNTFENAIPENAREDFTESMAQSLVQVLRDNAWLMLDILRLETPK